MSQISSQRPDRELVVVDRVRIRQGHWLPLTLAGQVGTVVEIFRQPRDSCMVRIAGDGNRQREWFFYRDEVMIDKV